jgi:peptide/nickel transport system permease protein
MTTDRLAAAAPPAGRRTSAPARVGLVLVGAVCVVAVAADVIAPGDPFTTSNDVLRSPSLAHPFGSDDFGRDLFTAVVHGTRACLLVALAATAMAMSLGILVGATAGYSGGRLDDLLMRITEVFQVVPRFFLVVTTVALFGSGLPLVILVLALTSWASTARLVRAQVMSAATFDHVAAARAIGARPWRIIRRHILPIALPPLVAHAAFQGSGAILAEAGVSFLGLGDPSVMTWGALLHEAHHFLRVAWWLAVFPGLALTVTVLGLHLVADGAGDTA